MPSQKISALATAISSRLAKWPRCAGAISVISATCGAHHLHQRTDFAMMVHADLEHAVIHIGGHTGKCQRHAPMIVERGGGSMNPCRHRTGTWRRASLGGCLADRTRHGDDLRLRARAQRCQADQGFQHVLDHDHRHFCIAESRQAMFRHNFRSPAPAAMAAVAKSWPSNCSPLMAEKASPGFGCGYRWKCRLLPPADCRTACLPWLPTMASDVQSQSLNSRLLILDAPQDGRQVPPPLLHDLKTAA